MSPNQPKKFTGSNLSSTKHKGYSHRLLLAFLPGSISSSVRGHRALQQHIQTCSKISTTQWCLNPDAQLRWTGGQEGAEARRPGGACDALPSCSPARSRGRAARDGDETHGAWRCGGTVRRAAKREAGVRRAVAWCAPCRTAAVADGEDARPGRLAAAAA